MISFRKRKKFRGLILGGGRVYRGVLWLRSLRILLNQLH